MSSMYEKKKPGHPLDGQGLKWRTWIYKLLYADDTIILTSTKQAAEIILHRIPEEPGRYNMKLNQSKCIGF